MSLLCSEISSYFRTYQLQQDLQKYLLDVTEHLPPKLHNTTDSTHSIALKLCKNLMHRQV